MFGPRFNYKAIRQLREGKGLSVAQFADTLKVSRQLVHQWEAGITKPGINSLEKLMDTYEVGPEVFFIPAMEN